MMDFHYRIGSMHDFSALRQLGIAAYSEFKDVLSEDNWQRLIRGLSNDELLSKIILQSRVFICEAAGQPAGVAYFISSGNPEGVFEKEWSYIRRVGVHPQYRGNGIARELTRLCISHAKETNEKIIALHTSEFMHAARHTYEQLGFVKMREIDPIFGKRYWLYTLQL